MAAICRSYVSHDEALKTVHALLDAGIPGAGVRVLTGEATRDAHADTTGEFAGSLTPGDPVGSFGDAHAAGARSPARDRRLIGAYSLVGLRSMPSLKRRSTSFSGESGSSSSPSLKRPCFSVPGGTSREMPRAKFGSSSSSGVSRSWS